MKQAMDSLEAKRRLIEWLQTRKGAGYCAAAVEVLTSRNPGRKAVRLPTILAMFPEMVGEAEEGSIDPVKVSANLVGRLKMANPFWTSEDMTRLVVGAAAKRPSSNVAMEDAPQLYGFAYLAEPAVCPDGRSFKAFLWAQKTGSDGKPGFDLIFLSSTSDAREPYVAALRGQNASVFTGAGPFTIAHAVHVPFGEEVEPDFYLSVALTWWHLIKRPAAVQTVEEADSRQVKRWQTRVKMSPGRVTVINLRSRPAEGPGREPGTVDWSHRWIVDGYWRKQWYGSGEDKRCETIYIDPFVKGPADKPLVIRTKVYSWIR